MFDENLEKLKKSDYMPEGIDKTKFDEIFNKYLEHLNYSDGKPGDAPTEDKALNMAHEFEKLDIWLQSQIADVRII